MRQEFNHRQEFPLLISFYYKDEKGQLADFGFPPYDFKIIFWTVSRTETYMASCRYVDGEEKCVNCRRVGDKLLVIFDNYRLQPGELHSEMTMNVPSDLYPDGYRKDVILIHPEVRLIHGPTPAPSRAEVTAILPYIKGQDGKNFTYEDLTEEQLKDLTDKISDRVMGEGVEEKIDDAIKKKLEEEMPGGMEEITDSEFDNMFNELAMTQNPNNNY